MYVTQTHPIASCSLTLYPARRPKSSKHKKERQSDFTKAKLKLGKGKQVAANATNTSVSSKGIALPAQSLSTAGSKGTDPVSRRNLTLPELLVQARHYSTAVKKTALQESLDLLERHPPLVPQHLLPLTSALVHLVADPSASVRALVRQLLALLAEALPRASLVQVTAPPLLLFTLAALSSLQDPVRIDALLIVDLLLAKIPNELVRGLDLDHPLGRGASGTASQDASSHDASAAANADSGAPGPRLLEALLSLLKVRAALGSETASVLNGGMTSAAHAASLSDLDPRTRVRVLRTLERFLREAGRVRRGVPEPRQGEGEGEGREDEEAAGREEEDEEPWYLAGAFATPEAYRDFVAGSFSSTVERSRKRVRVEADLRGAQGVLASPVERFDLACGSTAPSASFSPIGSLGLWTPPASPPPTTTTTAIGTSTPVHSSAPSPSLLALLHPTLLSSFLDSAPSALDPSAAAAASSNATSDGSGAGEQHHLETVAAVVSLARQLCALELARPAEEGNDASTSSSSAAVTATVTAAGARRKEARRLLLAFLTHASPYFPFGSPDAVAVGSLQQQQHTLGASTGAGTAGTKRPTVAQQVAEERYLSLNLSFAELSSLLVLSSSSSSSSSGSGDDTRKKVKGKGKGKGPSRKELEAERVEAVVLERVQDWVVRALRGELPSASSPLQGVTLSPSAFTRLEPTLWALLNHPDADRSEEVFAAVVEFMGRQKTGAAGGGGAEAKRWAMRFVASCVMVHASPTYTAPFDLSPLAARLPARLGSPNAKEAGRNALAVWLVGLPKYLWELGAARERREEVETLLSLSPLLTPFFHLVHPKTRAPLPGPFTRLPADSNASRLAVDLVWYLGRSAVEEGETVEGVEGLVKAVETACEAVGGEVQARWEAVRRI
ncbi:rRNA processing protein [Rhodotorula sphaerocarpa]